MKNLEKDTSKNIFGYLTSTPMKPGFLNITFWCKSGHFIVFLAKDISLEIASLTPILIVKPIAKLYSEA